uniref:GIY-YIG domain-containing protein n=1 Tax=viral metagenome TaxID=1070528 RepID=A0A6C0J0I0_9ZZZZ
MSVGSIYKIEFPNGKNYIGLTSRSLEDRQKEHKICAKSDDTKCLYKALRKYEMVDTFELVEIDTADTLEELCEKEIGYILSYNSYYMDGNGYNMTYGGEGFNGYVYTEEDNRKNSERRKQYFEDNPEARETCSKAQKKRFENPEARKKSSESGIKRFENPDEREKHCIRMKKRFEDNPELRENLSELKKKYYEDNPEAIKKMSERRKQYFEDNPEARETCSKAQKKRFENPDERAKNTESSRNYWNRNETAKQNARDRTTKYHKEHPELGVAHGEIMKKKYEDNPEMRKKQSEAQKKRFENPEHKKKILDTRGKNKPFDVSKIDGTFIKTFNYVFEATEYLQKEHNITSLIKVGEVLNGNRNSSAGFVFKYKE